MKGVERKIRRMVEAELRDSTERAFEAYGKPLETVSTFKYGRGAPHSWEHWKGAPLFVSRQCFPNSACLAIQQSKYIQEGGQGGVSWDNRFDACDHDLVCRVEVPGLCHLCSRPRYHHLGGWRGGLIHQMVLFMCAHIF